MHSIESLVVGESMLRGRFQFLPPKFRRRKIDAKCEKRESIVTVKTLLLLIALMCNASAFARLGETTAQIDKRYGQPLETIRNNGESRRYSFREFTVLVGFERGISECEVYQKKDSSRMTQAEIQGLLQVNAGSSEWSDDPEENIDNYVYWSRDKRTRVAIYTLATHGLMVTSKAFLPRFAHLVNSSDRRKMQGF
jgi:hypothetical protein